jgi:DNA repair exonuclease SbcCD ATPase subunit
MIVHICKKNGEIDESLKEKESEIEVLYRKINELELRVENQEQYSRRTSLRFHNIRVPLNNRDSSISPFFLQIWTIIDACFCIISFCSTIVLS